MVEGSYLVTSLTAKITVNGMLRLPKGFNYFVCNNCLPPEPLDVGVKNLVAVIRRFQKVEKQDIVRTKSHFYEPSKQN